MKVLVAGDRGYIGSRHGFLHAAGTRSTGSTSACTQAATSGSARVLVTKLPPEFEVLAVRGFECLLEGGGFVAVAVQLEHVVEVRQHPAAVMDQQARRYAGQIAVRCASEPGPSSMISKNNLPMSPARSAG